jgi:hypothetical protein
MSLQSVPPLSLNFFPTRPIHIDVSPAPLTSDAGLLPIREFDERIRLTERFAAAIEDKRDPTFTQQPLLGMVRQRIYGILADYEDQNDHDTLRSDPVFKLIADRLPEDRDLASQPTLSRFENNVSIPDLWRLRDALLDEFTESFESPPAHLTLDLDAFDDPAHGNQQPTFRTSRSDFRELSCSRRQLTRVSRQPAERLQAVPANRLGSPPKLRRTAAYSDRCPTFWQCPTPSAYDRSSDLRLLPLT